MSAALRRAAFKPIFAPTRALRASGINPGTTDAITQQQREVSKDTLKKGAKRDPELYVSTLTF